jgi:hypothetical protein
MNTPAFNRLIGRLIDLLPDSLSGRKATLLDILAVLPIAHPHRRAVEEMLQFLEGHEKHQLQLGMEFPQVGNPPAEGNGQPGK